MYRPRLLIDGDTLRLEDILQVAHNEAIVQLNIPTGIPLVYELDAALKPLRHYYLGDPGEVTRRTASVAAQGKIKV